MGTSSTILAERSEGGGEMSTDYYIPQYPVTHLEIAEGADYNVLTIWVSDGLSGVLNLPKSVTGAFIQMLTDDFSEVAMHTFGSKEGIVVEDRVRLPDDALVISGGGGLFTAGEVRAMAGKGK